MENDAYDFFNNLKKDDDKRFNTEDLFSEDKKSEALQEDKDEPSQEGDNTPAEDNVPFHKDRKIQRYIERQAEKIIKERLGDQPTKAVEPSTPTSSEIPSEWLLMYGDTPETREAWKYQSQLLEKVKQQAKQEAMAEFDSRFQKQAEEEKKYEGFITSGLESIEDSFGIDLTSNSPAAKKDRTQFLELVAKISPKDEAGNVLNYADFESTWELYQATKQLEQRKNDRQTEQKKDISSRSMARSTEGTPSPTKEGAKPLSWGDISEMFGR